MSVVRVDPESVRGYSRTASQQFEQMRSELVQLTDSVVNVHYYGPNAQQFKTECGELALNFSNALIADLGAIAEAVRASTSNISASLGGAPVVIAFDGSPISPPAVPAATEVVDIDTSALQALRPVVTQRFATLQSALDAHLSALQSTDWVGQAKEGAVGSVSQFTNSAKSKAVEAQSSINATIDQQISAVQSADR